MSHCIEKETVNLTLKTLRQAEKMLQEYPGFFSMTYPEEMVQFEKNIQTLKAALELECEWFVISVLHRTRPIGEVLENVDTPLTPLTDEEMAELANEICNDQGYDDALDLAIREKTTEHFVEKGLIKL